MIKTYVQWSSPVPIGLLLALAGGAAVVLILLGRIAGRPLASSRRWGLWTLRAAIVVLVAAILANPVRVEETPGTVERPRVAYLLDTSQSMALGEPGRTRWDQVLTTIREADPSRDQSSGPRLDLYRFGDRLSAISNGSALLGPRGPVARPSRTGAVAAEAPASNEPPPAPTDPDTRLTASLESLADRFGQAPPSAVVLFSDGRARDPARAEAVARGFGHMKIPIHVVPAGEATSGGDVAIVCLVAPGLVRKSSRVGVQVFVRSFGYAGKRVELKLSAIGADGRPGAPLAPPTPVVLADGLSRYAMTFPSGEEDRKIVAWIDPQPGEVGLDNNRFTADVAIDHTKIRVLYVEGSTERIVTRQGGFLGIGGREVVKGAYSPLQEALMEDPDIECTAVIPSGPGGDFSAFQRNDERGRGLPETPSELFAYDAIVLSNVPREALSDLHLQWIDDWVAKRGAGLCMIGGPLSFGSGRWAETTVGRMLPIDLPANARDWREATATLSPADSGPLHPIWHIAADDSENRASRKSLPPFLGANRPGRAKPSAEILATDDGSPALAVQPFGRGRTMAMTPAITRRWASEFQSWGGRLPILQEVLAQCRLLADRELLDRPPPPPGRDRQEALPPRRADPHLGQGLRRERGGDDRVSSGRLGRAKDGRRHGVGPLTAEEAEARPRLRLPALGRGVRPLEALPRTIVRRRADDRRFEGPPPGRLAVGRDSDRIDGI